MLALYLYIKNWLQSEKGQDLIEYALIIAVMVIAAVAGLIYLGPRIAALWSGIADWLALYPVP